MTGPLAGVRVLDLSRVLAGPWATQLMGDLGADVLKIERPDVGDDTRHWGPPFLQDHQGERTDAAYFVAANRNKRSVTIDFASDNGAALVRRLAAKADILVENYKTGALAKYGLDFPSLRAVNPKLVYCSITGFGAFGPYAHRAGYDYIIQGMSGLMSVTGEADGAPMKVGVAVSDLFTGMYAATAILAALRHAERSGEGQHLDAALLDCQIAALANQAQNYLVSGLPPQRLGNAHPNLTPYGPFETADDPLIVAVGNDGQFRALCVVLGMPSLSQDPRFADNPARLANRAALNQELSERFKTAGAGVWSESLDAVGVPAGPIRSIADALEDTHASARALIKDVRREDGAEMRLARYPVRLSAFPEPPATPPPKLGAHTLAAVQDWLGEEA